jgi:hypothetical protein
MTGLSGFNKLQIQRGRSFKKDLDFCLKFELFKGVFFCWLALACRRKRQLPAKRVIRNMFLGVLVLLIIFRRMGRKLLLITGCALQRLPNVFVPIKLK